MGRARVSGTAGLFNEIAKLAEKVSGIVRAGGGLGMVLDAEDRGLAMAHPFDGAVVEVDVGDFDIRGKRIRVHGKPVVLRGDGDPAVARSLTG